MALGRSVLSLSLTQRLLNNKSINFRDQQALQLPSTPTPSLSSVIKGSEKSCMVLHSSILNNLGRNEGLRDFILTVSRVYVAHAEHQFSRRGNACVTRCFKTLFPRQSWPPCTAEMETFLQCGYITSHEKCSSSQQKTFTFTFPHA